MGLLLDLSSVFANLAYRLPPHIFLTPLYRLTDIFLQGLHPASIQTT